jgi:4-hydroxy-tetrahydrodipicolinate reductase
MAIKLVVSGCCGKMGSSIARLARPSAYTLIGAIETKNHPAIGKDLGEVLGNGPLGVKITDDPSVALETGDVLIEFTTPEATMEHLQLASSLKKAMVVGTTGLSDEHRQRITKASSAIPIVFSPNMSVGVNVLFELAQLAAERLTGRFDFHEQIIEKHHQHKKDTPSGTAKQLQELIGKVRSRWRLPPDVECESIREGEIVGDHTVLFSNQFERLELTHHAETRDVFAVGALKAAQFVAGKSPGLYSMADVLRMR